MLLFISQCPSKAGCTLLLLNLNNIVKVLDLFMIVQGRSSSARFSLSAAFAVDLKIEKHDEDNDGAASPHGHDNMPQELAPLLRVSIFDRYYTRKVKE